MMLVTLIPLFMGCATLQPKVNLCVEVNAIGIQTMDGQKVDGKASIQLELVQKP
jgi:hypothetical protein